MKDWYFALTALLFIIVSIGLMIESQKKIVKAQSSTDAEQGDAPAFTLVEMNVSAYCKSSCCCGKWADGTTASGVPAVGLICAAPPEYPFGTKMDVGGVVYTVQDRGGAIKGNKLDLLFPSHQEALNFGRQQLTVKVYEREEK